MRPLVRYGPLELRVDGFTAQMAFGLAIVAITTVIGWALRLISPEVAPAALMFPAILFASLVGGWRSGATAGVLALVARTFTLRPVLPSLTHANIPDAINYALYALAAAAVISAGSYARSLLEHLRRSRDAFGKQSLNYSTLLETIPEGFAICEAVRDDSGRLVDYSVTEINPALRRMLGVGAEAVGARLTDTPGNWTAWLSVCDDVLTTGRPANFERFSRATKLWHEVHVSRLTETRMAQFFFDITARKADEARQVGLFEELNHRVRNNLAMVAGLLQLQARGASKTARHELTKAAARVQGIAEVHDALTHSGGHEVDFGAYLQALCAGLRKTLGGDDRVAIRVEAEPVKLPMDTAVPLGMVVNELVTNAMKYAYPGGEAGSINVSFRSEGDYLFLAVSDNGVGLPVDSQPGRGRLGMRLVRSLVGQVDGELDVRGDGGAEFHVKLQAAAGAR